VTVPTDVLLLSLAALLSVVALGVAIMAVRAARGRPKVAPPAPPAAEPAHLPRPAVLVPLDSAGRPVDVREGSLRPEVLQPRHVEGRVVVPPTGDQVVNTALSRPYVRLSILVHGLSHALRPESRDRITALMRREYRRRRRERLAAGRRAVRAARPTSPDAWMDEPWMGELPARPHATTGADS
jgi:hypothetical protein